MIERTPTTDAANWLLCLAAGEGGYSRYGRGIAMIHAERIAMKATGRPIWHRDWAALRMRMQAQESAPDAR